MGSTEISTTPASAERRRRFRAAGMVVGILACTTVVLQSSHATFTSTSSTGMNTIAAGTASITDNDGGSALFTAPALGPGDSATVCMGVRYTGSLAPTAIKFYADTANATESNDGGATYVAWANDATSEMDDNVTMRVQVNNTDLAANPTNDCAPTGVGTFTDVAGGSGTNLRALLNTNKDYASALPSQWGTITQNQWRVWKFTYTFASAAPTTAQGDSVKFAFMWEAQR